MRNLLIMDSMDLSYPRWGRDARGGRDGGNAGALPQQCCQLKEKKGIHAKEGKKKGIKAD
jgi:hypothetical protein